MAFNSQLMPIVTILLGPFSIGDYGFYYWIKKTMPYCRIIPNETKQYGLAPQSRAECKAYEKPGKEID